MPDVDVVEVDTDFPRNLPATVDIQRLRQRREREAQRSEGRIARQKRKEYVLPLRIFCFIVFALLCLQKLEGNLSTWAVVFVPLWFENMDRVYNNLININEAILESRVDREIRYDILLPPIAKIVLDIGSMLTKIFLALRIDMESTATTLLDQHLYLSSPSPSPSPSSFSFSAPSFTAPSSSSFPVAYTTSSTYPPLPESTLPSYRQTFLPFWIAAGLGTFIICWTPDRPEVRHPDDTYCQRFWRQVTTGAIYGGTSILMPLLVVNKVDAVTRNSSWTMVFLPVWAVFVLAGVIGFLVLPIYAICILCDSLQADGLHTRADRRSVARLLMAFAYATSSTVVTLSMFLFALTTRLQFEDAMRQAIAQMSNANMNNQVANWNVTASPSSSSSLSSLLSPLLSPSSSSSSHLHIHQPSSAPQPSSIRIDVTNHDIFMPLILGLINLLVCVCYIRFVMIRQRILQRQLARQHFEDAIDPQNGGVSYSSASDQFTKIQSPILLVRNESTMLFSTLLVPFSAEMMEELNIGLFHEAAAAVNHSNKENGTEIEIVGEMEETKEIENTADVSLTKIVHKANQETSPHTIINMDMASKEATDVSDVSEEEKKKDTPYFFEKGTDSTCFICVDLPPSKKICDD